MKYQVWWGAVLSLFLVGRLTGAEVVINEIQYHPSHALTEAEDSGREWVEIHNRGTNTVDLHGWRLNKGVDFTFTNETLPPGGYLVVAASRTNFLARYPGVTNVVGDWSGRLSNVGDEIELLDASGESVTRVAYADKGEWAVRTRESADSLGLRGWDWFAPHDGEGATLELINAAAPNGYAQNWAASLVSQGTPGRANSVQTNFSAPFIRQVTHFPLVPRSSDPVAVSALIESSGTNGLVVTLAYRSASSTTPPAFALLTMFDDGAHSDGLAGDGVYGAVVPAQANNTVMEFYLTATDVAGLTRQWPAPARNAPDLGGGILPPEAGANALYQVDDTTYAGTQPFYRMILPESERLFLASIAGSLRNSDAAAHGSFVSVDPNGTEEHHSISVRRRGAGSRGSTIPNYRVNFATDRRWKGVTAINFNSQYTHSQVAGSVLAALAGLQAEFQKPVQLRVNNVNQANVGSPQFGSFAQQEVPDGDFAEHHYPEDPNGNLYRGSTGAHSATLAYLGTDPNAYLSAGYSKTSNGSEYDWSDLIGLTDALSNSPDATYGLSVRARVNVEQWMIYFAVFTLLDSKETSLGIGNGDDFAMYRGLLDPRFQLIGHDFDTVLGQGDTGGNVNDDIFRATAVASINRFLKHPEFAPIYYRTLTNLMATTFAPSPLGAALDQHLGSWVNAGVLTTMKTFAANRLAGVQAQVPLAISIAHSLPIQNGLPRTTVANVLLTGRANSVATRSVLVNGTPAAWSAWNARWTNSLTLFPGLNRVVVQSLDESGREFERASLDIWFDRGGTTDVSGAINGSVTWTATNGPYQINGPLVLPENSELIIEPGTTVYLAPGAVVTVNETGRILAQGTEARRIRFGRNPAVTGNWGSLDFVGAPGDNRFAYVDFEGGAGANLGGHTAQIHVNGSRIFFDHCTWSATPAAQYISFDASSFIVQRCTFPTYPAPVPASAGQPEMLHGVNGIPAGGYGIFRDNYFGHTWGFNDTIDFTGGNRPGAILQVIGNIFDGAGDDHLDLDSTDAWIEGNVFLHAHRDPARTDNPLDTASAISGGVDTLGQNSDWTIINNLFYDVDHVFLNKGNSTTTGNAGGRVAFLYNTVVHVAREQSGSPESEISVFNWSDNNVVLPDPAVGSGLYAAHNLFQDVPVLHRFYNPSNLHVVMENNLFPAAYLGTTNEWTGPGSGNRYLDANLNLASLNGLAVSNVTAALVRAAFQPRAGSPALGTGFGARDLGGLNPHGIAIGGVPEGTNSSNQATLTFGPGGLFTWGTNVAQPFGWTAFRWKLDDGPWSGIIPITNAPPSNNPASITLSNLSNGPHTVYAIGRNDAGFWQDDLFVYPASSVAASNLTVSRTWVVETNLSRVILSEVLARNVTAVPVGGRFPDLIELHNPGAKAADLSDMSLSDDPTVPRKFVFPPGTTLAPGGYLVVNAATGEAPGQIYLGFGLNDRGDGVYLFDRLAAGGPLLDSVAFGLQLPDLSIGRQADGNWVLSKPTFGSANVAQPLGDATRLRVNEWFAAAGDLIQEDYFELFNPDPFPVAVGGFGLSHAPMSAPLEQVIPALSFMAGGGWQSFLADGDAAAGADHVGFKLDADGGWISVARPDGGIIDMIVYGTQVPDLSQGRSPDGGQTIVSFNQPTPGAGNPGSTVVVTPVINTLVPFNQTWRMESSGTDLGTTWRNPTYDDSGWFSGPALFYNYDGGGSQPPPIPQNSTVPFLNPKQTTVYFRTAFNYTGNPAGLTFLLSHVIDDGCVLYLNNQEIYRFNFAAGVSVTYSSRPSLVSGGPVLTAGVPISLPNLLQGTNQLAIEVHQNSATSSDIAMAIQLESQQLITNYLGTPVVLSEIFTRNESFTNAAGRVVDWVELYNPSTNLVDISDLSLTDDPGQPRRWVFPSGATIAPGGYYVVEFDDAQPYSPFNAGFELSADSGAVYLFNRPLAGGALVDSVVYGIQVADLSLGRSTAGLNNSWGLGDPTRAAANLAVSLGSPAALKVNEWMPNPPNGEDDWFEIYNPGNQPVALGGLRLTDNLSNPLKHTIRPLSFIGTGPQAWVKFIADNNTLAGGDHVAFQLANTEAIGLYSTGAVPAVIDFVIYAGAQNGYSYGRLPDGATNVVTFADSASPKEPNWLPLRDSVVINEVLSHPEAPGPQAIEIRNPGDVDVAIGGWYLSNSRRDRQRFLIPPGTLVPANGFKVFLESEFNPGQDVPPSFALNGHKSDEVLLSVADANGNLTGYRVGVDFGAAAEGVPFGRYEKSAGEDFVAMTAPSFGGQNPYPRVGPAVINEIHYHPPNLGTNDNTLDEFIELLNGSTTPLALFDPSHPTNTWRLRNAVDFDFPTNLTLPAHGFLLVVGFDPVTNAPALADFRARYGVPEIVPVIGPWQGKLDNSSEAIELQRPDAPVAVGTDAGLIPYILVERVKYSDAAPWPAAADGNSTGQGYSLQRRVWLEYGNDAVNWLASTPSPGRNTAPEIGEVPWLDSLPADQIVAAGSNVTFSVSAGGTFPLSYQWRRNGLAIPGATNATLSLNNVQALQAGRYSVLVVNPWGSALGGPARLSVQAPPQIAQQPQSRTVVAGQDTTFIVTASGGALQYQWRFGGTNLPAATNGALTLANVQPSLAGAYDVVVRNSFGSATSQVATLGVIVPPAFTTQPQSLAVIVGNSAGFAAVATGTAPLSYQWRKDGVNLPGATGPTYTIGTTRPGDAGDYLLVVTNPGGARTSQVATLTVIIPPTVSITAPDANASEPGANTGQFTLSRTGVTTEPLTVHLSIGGTAVPGSDYTAIDPVRVFPAGVALISFFVSPLNDAELEGDETVILSLTNTPDYLVASPGQATVVIHDEDNPPPIISLLTPTNGELFVFTPTNLSLTVTASDPNGTVARVDYFANGTNALGFTTNAPFAFVWSNAPAGNHVLTARATDNLGSTADSAPVSVVLNALPSVGVVSPVAGSTFSAPASFTVNALATDADGSVTQVLFYANATQIGLDTVAPYSVSASALTAGAYGLRAVAWDNRGAVSTSAVVTVVVNQPGVFDDFEPDIDLSQWSIFGGPVGTDIAANANGGSVSPTHSLWFGGDGARSAATRSVDTTLGGTINFQLRISDGTGNNWESADLPGEGVVLEYSVNGGGAWTVITTYDTAGAPYTVNWTQQQVSIPAGAQSASTQFRWRQLSHSGSCCDHWAIDDVQILVGPTPPTIANQPSSQFAVAGGSASFAVTVFGSSPFTYQWRFQGTNLVGATNATLGLANVSSNAAGFYSVAISNAYGFAISSNALLTVIEAGSEYFRITALTGNNSAIVEHNSATGDDRGGIATSGSQVFVTGDTATGRFAIGDLTGGTSVGTRFDALVGDLRTETAYTFGTDAATPILNDGSGSGNRVLTHLLELDPVSGVLSGKAIALTPAIPLANFNNYGFFSGYGRVVIHNGQRVYHVSLPSGVVTDLGVMTIPNHSFSESWGYWGVAELDTNGVSLVYVRDSQTILRSHVPDGATNVVASFTSLSDMASFTLSVARSRWYFHHESSSQFGGSDESVGYADATFALSPGTNLPPMLVLPPQNAAVLQGGNAAFAATAVGSPSLSYQWRFNGADLPGAIAATLTVFDVQPDAVGQYSVVVTNAFGAVTSAPVTLQIALPPVITNQPQSLTVLSGETATFTVEHSGDGPFTYQWRFNQFDFSQTTSNVLVLPAVNFYYNGLISVEVRNAVGAAVSSNAALVVLSAPFLAAPATDLQVLEGMNATLGGSIAGTLPISYQWQREGVALAGETNMNLFLPALSAGQAGLYVLVASNAYGSLVSTVALEVLQIAEDSFAIRSLTTNNAVLVNAQPVVGFHYYNGLATSLQRVFLNGDSEAGAFSASDLSGGAGLGDYRHGLVSDLRSRKVYSMASGTNLLTYTGPFTNLIELDALSGQPTTNRINLSTNLYVDYYSAVFSGYGRMVLVDGSSRAWDISLPGGQVRDLGTMSYFNYAYANGFAYRGWGIAERIGTNLWLAHVRDFQTIERVRVPDGKTEVIATFPNLGSSAANFTVSVPRNRWYYNFTGSGLFTNGVQHGLVAASASFIYRGPSNVPPSFLEQPAGRFVPKGTTAYLGGVADGSGPLRYQWWRNGVMLPGETNDVLALTNANAQSEGGYFVTVTNQLGAITSLVAAVTVDYGASSSNTIPLLSLTGTTWRYHTNAGFPSSNLAWTGSNYNDSAWTGSGLALLAWENASSIRPFTNTWLAIGKTSYYFRAWFNVPSNFPAGTVLRATAMIDDGAVIFINGKQVQRVRMTSGAYGPTTFANAQPSGGDAVQETFFWLASTNLVRGSNVIAAEVHQQSASSSDIVWGLALDALVPVLNRPPTITLHPASQTVTNGTNVTFLVTATGSGPLTYQWQHEGTNIPGATSSALVLNNVQRRHEGQYQARVTNPHDSVFSNPAALVVIVPSMRFLGGGAVFAAPGRFTLSFQGDAGAVYSIETSTNLIHWTSLGTVTNAAGSAQFEDATAADSAQRFYRLRLGP